MANRSFYTKWLLALLAIVAILILVYLTHLPETEEIPEQVEEIEWQDIDRVEIIADEEVYIVRDEDGYQLLKDDKTYRIELGAEKVNSLFQTFRRFKSGRKVDVDFNEWIKDQPDTSAIILKLYTNTEQVLNLYIHPADSSIYYRYYDSNDVYSTKTISKEQFQWLDSLRE